MRRRAAAARALLATGAALAACALQACSSHAAPPAYQGYVEGEFVYVGASQPGRLQRLEVARGQPVAANAPLFSLESTDETAARDQAERLLAAAQAQLADLRTGKRVPELDVIRAQIEQGRASERTSSAAYRRDEAQYRAGGLSRAQLDASRALAEANTAHVQELEHQLEVAALPGRQDQIKAQTAQVAAATAALAQARWKLDEKSVAAPSAGLVYDTLYRVGEWVAAGNPVVRLLPPQNIKLRLFVPESALGAVAVGQRVLVNCDGCRQDIAAKIDYVAAESEYTPPVIFSNESRAKLVYLVEARPAPAQAAALHPGQPVLVRLQ
jgi:HlyD family secretion protein